MYTVLVCGGRDLDPQKVTYVIEKCAFEMFPRTDEDEYGNFLYEVRIVCGGAKGADEGAVAWAVVNWSDFKEYPADWKKHGKAAGPIRNQQMLDEEDIDLVLAFPGGRGTADMVQRADKAGAPIINMGEYYVEHD